jgi:ubiquinone/menaquinone biosynthesis C-methylase UbiE
MTKSVGNGGISAIIRPMSTPEEKQSINRYYDERAPEYEEIYKGTGPASIRDPKAYQQEVGQISALLSNYIAGNHIDLACGTAFWLPSYQAKCSHITLFDQSEQMLVQCSHKVDQLNIGNKTQIIRGDVFGYRFLANNYDCTLAAFLLSHLDDSEMSVLFRILRRILRPDAKFVLIDSIWTDERKDVRRRSGLQKRRLNDGREFEIYKRYFTEQDLMTLASDIGMNLDVVHAGRAFIAAVGSW